MVGENQLARESFLDARAYTPDQIADHAIKCPIYLYQLINNFVHCLLGFARIDPCVRNKHDDQEQNEDNDQDCFGSVHISPVW